jgi:hypothetical protein
MRRNRILLVSSALLAGLVLGGCSADSGDSAAPQSGAAGVANEGAKVAEPQTATDQAPGGSEAKDTPAQAPDLGVDQRSIIYRGSLSVRVKDVNAAASQATGIVKTAGGFVSGDNRSSGSGSDTATMELRVPADKFATVVDQLSKQLGTEEQRQISTEDVTEQTVDLDARIAVQQARVDSGRRLLAQAKSLNDLVMLEKEVATRESDLASLQAKKRRLADLTALSTISVSLLSPQAAAPKQADPSGFLSGLTGGWKALVTSLGVLLTVIGALLPWVLAIGLPAWIGWLLFRRFRPGRPAPAGAAPAEAAEQP